MSTNYPGAKDTFSTKQDNNGVKIAAADVNNLQDAVDALEQTVGYGATQPTATPTADAIAKWDSNKSLSAAAFIPQGLTGATAASRYAGATSSGAPTTGTFAVGDFIVSQGGDIWICTVAGTPGTWIPLFRGDGNNYIQSGSSSSSFATGQVFTGINFPNPFKSGSTPLVIAGLKGFGTSSSGTYTIWATGESPTGFSLGTNFATAQTVSWGYIAIGVHP